MNLQQFWELRESESGSPKISSEFIKYFLDDLAAILAVPIEVDLEKEPSFGIYIRWRTQTTRAGVLKLGLEGFFSIILGQDLPRLNATVFVFSNEDKLFPQTANQGYFDMKYEPNQGWKMLGWYMDEFKEFLEKKYSGEVPEYQPIIISRENEKFVCHSILHQVLQSPINISSEEETSSFSSKEPLFGILELEFTGKLKSVSNNPQAIEMTVGFNAQGNRLAVGQINKLEKVLRLTSSNEKVWDYQWEA